MRCLLVRLGRELGSKQKQAMRNPTFGFPLVCLFMVSTSSTHFCLNPAPQHQPHSLCCGSSYYCLLRNLCGHLTQDSPPFSRHLPGLTCIHVRGTPCIHIRGTPWHHADDRTSGLQLICVYTYTLLTTTRRGQILFLALETKFEVL